MVRGLEEYDEPTPDTHADRLNAAEQLRQVQGEMAQLTAAVTALERMTPKARELALGYLNRRYGRVRGNGDTG